MTDTEPIPSKDHFTPTERALLSEATTLRSWEKHVEADFTLSEFAAFLHEAVGGPPGLNTLELTGVRSPWEGAPRSFLHISNGSSASSCNSKHVFLIFEILADCSSLQLEEPTAESLRGTVVELPERFRSSVAKLVEILGAELHEVCRLNRTGPYFRESRDYKSR